MLMPGVPPPGWGCTERCAQDAFQKDGALGIWVWRGVEKPNTILVGRSQWSKRCFLLCKTKFISVVLFKCVSAFFLVNAEGLDCHFASFAFLLKKKSQGNSQTG